MNVNHAVFKLSAFAPEQFIRDGLPQAVFVGRSNVGKSSVINTLTGRKALARVGSAPGKTRSANYFLIDNRLYFVDLPGYGYAKVSKSVTENWGAMMETYFRNRRRLLKVVLLADIRHTPTAQDIQMYEYMRHYGLDGVVAATKADKISKNEQREKIRTIRETLGLSPADRVIPVSALKRSGTEELLAEIDAVLRGGALPEG
ncbi:MAG: ribosome biogenesis GTP-binding protein YihA/YsxC [Oscillospiraceae bacterium]|nr:ribosome biogenesis GTP-binding protein YihA/YsxC [Oscillospiraceae bacterium]